MNEKDIKSTGLRNILQLPYETCVVCFEEKKPNEKKKYYACGRHSGHYHCVLKYLQAEADKDPPNRSKFACPMRCPWKEQRQWFDFYFDLILPKNN